MYRFPGRFGENVLPYGRHQCLPYCKDAVRAEIVKHQFAALTRPYLIAELLLSTRLLYRNSTSCPSNSSNCPSSPGLTYRMSTSVTLA